MIKILNKFFRKKFFSTHAKLFTIIFLLITVFLISTAVLKKIKIVPRASEPQKIVVSGIDIPTDSKRQLEQILNSALNKDGIFIPKSILDGFLSYLLPQSRFLSSISITLYDKQLIESSFYFKDFIVNNITIKSYIDVVENAPRIEIKELKIYAIPIPSVFWSSYIDRFETDLNKRIKKNFIKYNASVEKLLINSQGITFSGTLPKSFIDPVFWQEQNNILENRISRRL